MASLSTSCLGADETHPGEREEKILLSKKNYNNALQLIIHNGLHSQ